MRGVRVFFAAALSSLAACSGGGAAPAPHPDLATGTGVPTDAAVVGPADAATGGAPPADMAAAPADLASSLDLASPLDLAGADMAGQATLTGEMNGYTVSTVRSVFSVITATSFNVYISDRADLCRVLQDGAGARGTSFMRVGSTAESPQPFPAGAYTYPSGSGSGNGDGTGGGQGGVDGGVMGTRNAVIAASDDRCILEGYNQAAYGQFVIDGPVDTSTTAITGNFDVTFGVGALFGEIQGSFVAPVCPGAIDIGYLTPTLCE